MKGKPAWPGGPLTSKPTWRKTSWCSTASAFFARVGESVADSHRDEAITAGISHAARTEQVAVKNGVDLVSPIEFVIEYGYTYKKRMNTAPLPSEENRTMATTSKDPSSATANTRHPAAEHHHKAASHHAAAAHHHLRAAHHLEVGEHEPAKKHSEAARRHSGSAHKHTTHANELSSK